MSASLSPPTAVLQHPGDLAAYDTVHLRREDAPLQGPTSTLQLRIQAVYPGASAVGTAESVRLAAERVQHLSAGSRWVLRGSGFRSFCLCV